jgi:DNA-binding NarL/FixJ family response regulator
MTIHLAIVDDHPVVTDGLRGALSQAPGIEVTWTASTVDEARSELSSGQPVDVVLVDVRLPDGSGLSLLPGSRSSHPAFVVLSSFDRTQYANAAFKRGASGYLLKVAPIAQILDAVHTAAAGGLAFDERHLASVTGAPSLTRREVEVVRLVSTGHSNDEIAVQLGISRKTVEAYLSKLYERWGFMTRTELAIWAEREGWLDIPTADEA